MKGALAIIAVRALAILRDRLIANIARPRKTQTTATVLQLRHVILAYIHFFRTLDLAELRSALFPFLLLFPLFLGDNTPAIFRIFLITRFHYRTTLNIIPWCIALALPNLSPIIACNIIV
jgi:hypothetical protein